MSIRPLPFVAPNDPRDEEYYLQLRDMHKRGQRRGRGKRGPSLNNGTVPGGIGHVISQFGDSMQAQQQRALQRQMLERMFQQRQIQRGGQAEILNRMLPGGSPRQQGQPGGVVDYGTAVQRQHDQEMGAKQHPELQPQPKTLPPPATRQIDFGGFGAGAGPDPDDMPMGTDFGGESFGPPAAPPQPIGGGPDPDDFPMGDSFSIARDVPGVTEPDASQWLPKTAPAAPQTPATPESQSPEVLNKPQATSAPVGQPQAMPQGATAPYPERNMVGRLKRHAYAPLIPNKPAIENVKGGMTHDVSATKAAQARGVRPGPSSAYAINIADDGKITVPGGFPKDSQGLSGFPRTHHGVAYNGSHVGIARQGYEGEPLTPAAADSMALVMAALKQRYGLTDADFLTHRQAVDMQHARTGPKATNHGGKDKLEGNWTPMALGMSPNLERMHARKTGGAAPGLTRYAQAGGATPDVNNIREIIEIGRRTGNLDSAGKVVSDFIKRKRMGEGNALKNQLTQKRIEKITGEIERGDIRVIDKKIVRIGKDGVPRQIYNGTSKIDRAIQDMVTNALTDNNQTQRGGVQLQSGEAANQDPNLIRTQAGQPAAPARAEETFKTPFGPMTKERAQKIGTGLALGGKGDAGKIFMDIANQNALSKKARGKIDTEELNAVNGLARIREIAQGYKPKYLTWEGWAEFQRIKFLDSFESTRHGLPPEQRKEFAEYSQWRQSAAQNLNRYIKEITGAQMSFHEEGRIRKGMPDYEKDSPGQFLAKLKGTHRNLQLVIARSRYLRKNGFTGNMNDMEGTMSFEMMGEKINHRTNEIVTDARKRGVPDDQIKGFVRQQLREEFGFQA